MKNLRMLRDEKGVSQQKVADAIGSNQQSIHRYENGDYEPDIQTLILLADYFDTSIDFLVGRVEIRKKIEPVYEYNLNVEEAGLVNKYRAFTKGYRKFVVEILQALSDMVKNED